MSAPEDDRSGDSLRHQAGGEGDSSPAMLLGSGLCIIALTGLLILAVSSHRPALAFSFAILAAFGMMLALRRRRSWDLPRSAPLRAVAAAPEARLNAVLDAISSPTVLIDRRGNVVHANSAAYAAFPGLRREHPLSFVVRAPNFLAILESVLTHRPEAQTELVERVPVARSFDVIIRRLSREQQAAPGEPGIAFAVVSMPETTAAKRLEAMRVDFVANASHELRTPLASILGFIETLQGAARDDAAARKSFLVIMQTQARRMARLIEDLLSLSKIEMSEHIAPSDRIDLGLLVRSVCDVLSGLAKDRGVVLEIKVVAEAPVVTGDRDELLRVFENLIENAIKYGQSGGRVDVEIEAVEEAGKPAYATIIRDYGPGIAPEHLPRLTERFYRADVNESRGMGGTGLGLAIVKHIVTRHRGRLAIESMPGKGSSFTVVLQAAGE